MLRKILSLFKKIDHVQGQVDDLTDTLDDTTDNHDRAFSGLTYGMSQRQCLRLGVMILKLQDDCLSTRSRRKFPKLINANKGAARYYFEFQEQSLMLHALFRPELIAQGCIPNL